MTSRELTNSLPEFIIYWGSELGLEAEEITKLEGGINNQVYRCGSGKNTMIAKGFPIFTDDRQDRMIAEIEFLRYASVTAPGLTPKLIHVDHERRCILLEDVGGERFLEGEVPTAVMISRAIEFLQLLNRDRDMAKEHIRQIAREGFLSLTDHVQNVKQRVEALDCRGLDGDDRLYADRIKKIIERGIILEEKKLIKAIAIGAAEDTISKDQLYVSPSDFGFHNAIKTPEGLTFIDFEFAGWDDPAKASLDFLLQPRIPIACVRSPLIDAWSPNDRSNIRNRCIHLGPILELKWACIMLAVLDPKRLERLRMVKTEDEVAAIIDGQLIRITNYIKSKKHIWTI